MLSARGAVTQARRRTQERHRKGHDAGKRFGGDAGAEGRSAEFGQMDEQVGEQAEESAEQPRAYDRRNRHQTDVTREGIFAESEQEAD